MWLTAALLVIGIAAGCRPGTPIVDAAPQPVEADGTISGTVRGANGAASIDGRIVEAVNLDTHERQRITTNRAGGYTLKVRPGRYRVELRLQPGETVVRAPGVLNVNRRDIDADADFLISTRARGFDDRSTRPRSPASRLDPGLGSPMA